jgi:[acyl-carrier-protein] S-malonyltransferase
MTKIAYIFPGQGSQIVGMGKDLFDNFPAARSVFEEADKTLGFSLSKMCFEGTTEELAFTANTQPAILTSSIAAFRVMAESGFPKPDFVAGHSLGEYSALVAANAITFSDAIKTVRQRGTFMQEAVPVGVGAMAAILGSDLATIEMVCREVANGEICSPANINSPSQIVIAGNSGAIDRACEMLKERGAKRAIKLNVSAPFHCALMLPAQEKLSLVVSGLHFNAFDCPIVENVSGKINSDENRIAEALTNQVSSPVRWVETIQNLIELGVDTFVEVGTGKVLSGLVKQISKDVRCLNVEDSASLRNTQEVLAI